MAARDPRSTPIGVPALRAMTEAIIHRGPDDDGHHTEPGVALGMRRLSIIDVEGSPQPVTSETGDVQAVFNGEIYNFRELRDELAARGHRFATNGDSETIVHLYEELGPDFVTRLRGMFAIALWDRPRRRLVLARDRMGVKPLYWAETPNGLAFASEVKSLIAGGVIQPELDPMAAELFLAHGFVPGPRSLFAGVRKLPPASLLVYEDGRVAEERAWWTPYDADAPDPGASWEEHQEELLRLMREAVRARMVADVPLGVMLSGGLDSSLITALMAESSSGPVKTFSIAFAEDRGSNELEDARRVANRFGTEHHELTTSATDHPDLLDEALWHLEEPVADVSCLGFLLLSRLARRDVTVALSGQGADELLGGYRKHEIAALAAAAQRFPRGLVRAAGAAGSLAPNGSTFARGVDAVTAGDPAQRLLAMSRVVSADERGQLLHPDFAQAGRGARDRAGRQRQPGRRAAERTRGDASARLEARARGQHAPLLRQDLDGGVTRGSGAVHGSRRCLVLLPATRLAPRLEAPPQGAAQAREPRPGGGRHHRQAEARLLPLRARGLARGAPRRAGARHAAG